MTDQSSQSQTGADTLLGRLVVERGLATDQEVDICVKRQKEALEDSDPNQSSLAQLLIREGHVTKKQIERLMPEIEEQKVSRQIPGYQILGKLGAGAMATVYKARQISLDRLVAIKVLPKKYTRNQDFINRFYAEGRAAAKLNHPNIVGALDVGRAGDTHYFVMEYVKGKSVFEEMNDNGIYSEKNALNIGIQIAKALHHAHQAGFIHRDVKPKNIMITTDSVAKLADMGLARAIEDRDAAEAESGKAFGTPYYISPEQIRGEVDVDFRADLYGLGATMYHMVTGSVPFDGPNPSAVMHKHLKQELVPPDHITKELTTGICEIIEVCMAKDRDKRYGSASELVEDLEAVLLGDAPIHARNKFDISSWAALDNSEATTRDELANIEHRSEKPLAERPLFWIALAGWIFVFILIVILVVMAPR
ncbi:Serine/threonine-protein kinase PknB [Poriferisphaera corsica]|uniref:non-specific serine/threonine protein kinase n=1 Tax=Poriferisphaera corsica TaxID=2528020 RepID=A0A517YSY4_9BACT|nr:serine/threonine-protein kinase [Poriferisphaera corsica]QDU33338.1 Serine/threonine-protein kinase PknB [Poriferisphaera corsica]